MGADWSELEPVWTSVVSENLRWWYAPRSRNRQTDRQTNRPTESNASLWSISVGRGGGGHDPAKSPVTLVVVRCWHVVPRKHTVRRQCEENSVRRMKMASLEIVRKSNTCPDLTVVDYEIPHPRHPSIQRTGQNPHPEPCSRRLPTVVSSLQNCQVRTAYVVGTAPIQVRVPQEPRSS